MNRLIYLDNAATTQVYPQVLDAMLPFFTEHYGNPSAIYSFANEAKKAVDQSRSTIADLIGANTDEIYFTGGGSESDNWALVATAEAYESKGKTHCFHDAIHNAFFYSFFEHKPQKSANSYGDSIYYRSGVIPFLSVFLINK